MGAGHCLGMCGGIAAALSFAVPDASFIRKLYLLLSYNVGRISSYVLIGLLAGLIGQWIGQKTSMDQGAWWMRVGAAIMLILMGLYVSGWWKFLGVLERIGAKLWRYLQPLANKLMPINGARSALLLGALWGWLPCGLVYSALVLAFAQADIWHGAGVMLAFGLGTLPAVLFGGIAAERLKKVLQSSFSRMTMGLVIMGFGAWTLYFSLAHLGHAGHAHLNHENSQEQQSHLSGSDYTEEVLESDPMPSGTHHHH